jgi:hypothetical protein
MPRESWGSLAEIEEVITMPPKDSVPDHCPNGCGKMTTNLKDITDEEINAREDFVNRRLTPENVVLIREGIEAYKAERPQLIEDHKCRQMVAYRGSERVALAPTDRELEEILKQKRIEDRGGLFITCVLPPDVEGPKGRAR